MLPAKLLVFLGQPFKADAVLAAITGKTHVQFLAAKAAKGF